MSIEQRMEMIFDDLMPGEDTPVRQRTLDQTAAWDSMCQLNLVIAIEQEFGISMTDAETSSLESYDAAISIVERHGVGD